MPDARLIAAFAICAACVYGQNDWPMFGHDAGGTRYSPLKQINTANVAKLQPAWTFHTGRPGSEATPVVVGGVMYLTSPNGIFAITPETGKQIWKYDGSMVALRGAAYWPGEGTTHARVYAGVGSTLVALDVTDGKPAPGFGNEGVVDLKQGVLGGLPDAIMGLRSPPVVYKNIVITGSDPNEGTPTAGAYGDVRGWDVLFSSHGAGAAAVALPSRVFAWFALVFGVGFSMLALMTRRWALSWVALAGSAIASGAGLLAVWSRQTVAAGHPGPGIGLIVAWITVILLTFHWARVVWSRTIVQLAAEEQRRRVAAQRQSRTLLDSVQTDVQTDADEPDKPDQSDAGAPSED